MYIIDPPSKQPIIRKFNSIKISFSRDNPYLLLPSTSSKILPLLVIAAETVLLLPFPSSFLSTSPSFRKNFQSSLLYFRFKTNTTQQNPRISIHMPSSSLLHDCTAHLLSSFALRLLFASRSPLAKPPCASGRNPFLHLGNLRLFTCFFSRDFLATEHKIYGTQTKNSTICSNFFICADAMFSGAK